MKIVLWGATGLIGSACLRLLLEDSRVSAVVAPTRKSLNVTHPRLANPVVNFDSLGNLTVLLVGATASICCLGSTIKQAGSREAFHKVDYGYTLAAAQLCREAGIPHWLQVSAIGASSRSPVFYSRVKGEMETALKALKFGALSIYHPSMLMGDRPEHRPLEEIGIKVTRVINPLMVGPLKPYRGIEDQTLARALVNNALAPSPALVSQSVQVYSYEKIVTLATGSN